MSKSISTLVLLCALFTSQAQAQSYVVNVHGIVCEFCSFGVAKNIRKLPFVDPSKLDKGVRVDIENQMVTVAVREGAQLDRLSLFKAIESGGYKPVTVWAVSETGERTKVMP